jgi:DNA-binding transcriptional ArsR family regulator
LTAESTTHIINRLVNNQKRITAIFAALADPTRRRILVRLSKHEEIPVTRLAQPFHVSPPAISRHLRVLENARLIDRRRQGRAHLIRAHPGGLKEAQSWINQCAAAWQFSFDALGQLLAGQPGKENET